MTEKELAALASWIANVGLEGAAETALVEGFCGRAVAAGLPLARAIVFIDTLHPIHEGRVFRWERDKPAATVSEYGRSTEGEAAERWRRSPHYRLLEKGESLMRRRVTAETERRLGDVRAALRGFQEMLEGSVGSTDLAFVSQGLGNLIVLFERLGQAP